MIAKPVVPGIYSISLGFVNTFLVDAGELTLIDTGIAGSEGKILRAIDELGKKPSDLRHILLTHLHADHTGALPALKKASGAQTYMHPLDAADYQRGITMRTMEPGPGLLNGLIARVFGARRPSTTTAAPIDQDLRDGEALDFAGGLRVIHAPGHTAGHVVLFAPGQGGVLIAGDACSHMTRLGWSMIYENLAKAQDTLRRLAALDFETACFSHGSPIAKAANRQFQAKFGI